MDTIEVFLRVALMGFSLLLFITSVVSYMRVRNNRLIFISLAFAFFFAKGLVLSLAIFMDSVNSAFSASMQLILLDFVILALIYLGIVKR